MRMEFGASNPEQELDSELKIDNDKDPDNKKAGPRSVQDKYTSYDDDVVEVILDESEVYEILDRGEESFYLQEDKTDVYSDIILQSKFNILLFKFTSILVMFFSMVIHFNFVFTQEERREFLICQNLLMYCITKTFMIYV